MDDDAELRRRTTFKKEKEAEIERRNTLKAEKERHIEEEKELAVNTIEETPVEEETERPDLRKIKEPESQSSKVTFEESVNFNKPKPPPKI